MKKISKLFVFALGIALLASCGSKEKEYVEVEVPTVGLITTVKEVEKNNFKIEDEKDVDSISDSRIIAKYLDGNIDTFTLEEAKLISKIDSARGTRSRSGSIARAASFGFMGYMMGRSMRGGSVSPGAYTNQNAYNRASSTAGTRMKSTSRTVRRPSPKGRSGFGSGRSSRSYGG